MKRPNKYFLQSCLGNLGDFGAKMYISDGISELGRSIGSREFQKLLVMLYMILHWKHFPVEKLDINLAKGINDRTNERT